MRIHRREIKDLSPQKRQDRGRTLLNMKGKEQGHSLEGFKIKFTSTGRLPYTEIGVGNLIIVSENDPLNRNNPTGTVTNKTKYSIEVAFSEKPDTFINGNYLRIDLYVNDITFQRMLEAIEQLKTKKNCLKVLLGKSKLDSRLSNFKSIAINNTRLNNYQTKAVTQAVRAKKLYLIHGPPGTGNTTTLIECIEQHIKNKDTVLATASSNTAVDNLVEFLDKKNIRVVRAGHPARVTKKLKK